MSHVIEGRADKRRHPSDKTRHHLRCSTQTRSSLTRRRCSPRAPWRSASIGAAERSRKQGFRTFRVAAGSCWTTCRRSTAGFLWTCRSSMGMTPGRCPFRLASSSIDAASFAPLRAIPTTRRGRSQVTPLRPSAQSPAHPDDGPLSKRQHSVCYKVLPPHGPYDAGHFSSAAVENPLTGPW